MNICFFGASVTAQKTGYVFYFKKEIDQNKINISQHGYGGMHMKDAGMCFIDDVLQSKPQYCFIDWFSTGYFPEESNLYFYLDNFRYKFLTNNCQIIFLLFGRREMEKNRLKMYDQVIKYAEEHEIPYINIYEKIKNECEEKLYRDQIHTIELGSYLYSKNIHQELNNIFKKQINKNNLFENKFSNIKKIKIEKNEVENLIKIKGSGEVLGIYQNIGPHSGIVKIDADGVLSKENIWDVWCDYERTTIKISKKFNNYLNIFVSQEDFDKSSAHRQTNWHVKKILKPIDLYYIGDMEITYIE